MTTQVLSKPGKGGDGKGAAALLCILTLAEAERDHILSTLALCGYNRTRTAQVLGISIRGLRTKLHTYERHGFAVRSPQGEGVVNSASSAKVKSQNAA
jgi:DNA-binding NtrC family response regulator